MEIDLYNSNNSLLFSTNQYLATVGEMQSEAIATVKNAGFTEFRQINSTHVVLVAGNLHCLYIMNRVSKNLQVLAGTPGIPGYSDGTAGIGKLFSPRGIELDIRDPDSILISDLRNKALRSVKIHEKELSTLYIRAKSFKPYKICWAGNNLLVVNRNNIITQITWSETGAITSTDILDPQPIGKSVQAFSITDMIELSCNIYLIASREEEPYKILNLEKHEVTPICLESPAIPCAERNYLSSSRKLLKDGRNIYVGIAKKIFKYSS